MQILLDPCGYLEHRLHLCRNGRIGLNNLFHDPEEAAAVGRRDEIQNIWDTVFPPCPGVCFVESPP